MEKVKLNGNKMKSKEEAHLYIKKKLKHPEYYGNNLDALWDTLSSINFTIKDRKSVV